MQRLLTVRRRSRPPSSCTMTEVLGAARVVCVVLMAKEILPPSQPERVAGSQRESLSFTRLMISVLMPKDATPRKYLDSSAPTWLRKVKRLTSMHSVSPLRRHRDVYAS